MAYREKKEREYGGWIHKKDKEWGEYPMNGEDDYDAYMDSIERGKWSLDAVPEIHRDYYMCDMALQREWHYSKTITHVPDDVMEYALAIRAVQNDMSAEALDYIRDEYKDYELYTEAAKGSMYALEKIPKEFIDYKICRIAVTKFYYAWNYVPKEFRDHAMAMLSVKECSGYALSYMTEYEQHPEVCLVAVSKHTDRIFDIKDPTRFVIWLITKRYSQLRELLSNIENTNNKIDSDIDSD